MHKLSARWVIASSLLVSGGLALAAIPAVGLELTGELASDGLIFFGTLLGGAVAVLASRRRSLAEVGLGAILTLLFTVGLLLIFRSSELEWDFGSSSGRALVIRRLGLFCVGAVVGAALGARRHRDKPITSGAFWAVVSMLTTTAMVMVVALFAVVSGLWQHETLMGLAVLFVAPIAGAMATQLMAPVRHVTWIATGPVVLILFALLGDPSEIGPAAIAGLICVGIGSVGARLGARLGNKPHELALDVPVARVAHGGPESRE